MRVINVNAVADEAHDSSTSRATSRIRGVSRKAIHRGLVKKSGDSPAGFCILLGGLPKGCRLPGRVPATLTLTLTFDLQSFAMRNRSLRLTFIRSHCWYPRDVGFRAHTSGSFCVVKRNRKTTPDRRLVSIRSHGAVANLFRVRCVIRRRHRITMAPPSALLTQKISRNIPRSSD